MFLKDVYSTLAKTYEAIDLRIVFANDPQTSKKELVFLKMIWCKSSEVKASKNWDFYKKLNKLSQLKFFNKIVLNQDIDKFVKDLINGSFQINDYTINLSPMEKLYLSSDFDVRHLLINLPELYPKEVEFPYLLIRPDYDKNCSLILNTLGIPSKIKGFETLKIIETFLDVKGTILINNRVVCILPIYCKLYESEGMTVEYHNKLIDDLKLLVLNDDVRYISFREISHISDKEMNKMKLSNYFDSRKENINISFEPLDLIIIDHENESLIELEQVNLYANDSESNQKLIKIKENQKLEKKSTLIYDHHQNQIDDSITYNVMRSIAAFLNSDGGILLLGINDNDEVLGLEKDFENLSNRKDEDGFENLLRNFIRDKYFKMDYVNSLLRLIFFKIEEKTICKIIINKSTKPIFLVNKEKCNVFFVRQGNGVRKLEGLDLSEYLSNFGSRTNFNYDLFDDA